MPDAVSANAVPSRPSVSRRPAALQRLRRSRALAALLPPFLSSGVTSLVATAIMRTLWTGWDPLFVSGWLEAWLTTWPVVFPLTYLLGRPLARLSARLSQSD